MTKSDALAEMIIYIAGGLERGDFNAAQITPAVLRALVDKARGLPDDVPIGAVWALADDAIRGGGPGGAGNVTTIAFNDVLN